MKNIVTGLLCVYAFIIPACRKEHSGVTEQNSAASMKIELDGEKIEKTYNPDQPDLCSVFSFGGFAGYYFVLTSDFDIDPSSELQIHFGTLLSEHTILTEDEFLQLVSPGEKRFGSLGSYGSYPKMTPGMVEIAYTDKKSRRWCSTSITEKRTNNGIDAIVAVEQPGSRFTISKIEKIASAGAGFRYKVTGTFNCFLYEVNGNSRKKLKGDFTGTVFYKS